MGKRAKEIKADPLREVLPEAIRSGQYYGTASLQSERALMIAVLENGVRYYLQYARARDAKGRRKFTEAEKWIRSRDVRMLFAFETICTVLGLDSDSVRRNLRRRRRIQEELAADP